MMTIAAAEVVGVTYYGMLRQHVPPIAAMARAIARDERRHLEMQATYFARVAQLASLPRRTLGEAAFLAIVACAVGTLVTDHAPLLRALGVRRRAIAVACAREALRAVACVRRGGPSGATVAHLAATPAARFAAP
jgi:hypothetical protein